MNTTPSKFTSGDRVRRKRGGPVMTVSAAPDHVAYCTWYSHGRPTQGTFNQEDLELAPDVALDSLDSVN